MITITWIIVPVVILILLAGIFATIVIRMNTIPNWKKIGKILCWIIGILLFKLLIWGIVCSYKDEATSEKNKKLIAQAIEARSAKYEWYWKLPAGVYIHGRNESPEDERMAEAIPRNDNSIWADLHYRQCGIPETLRIRLQKSGEKSFSGNSDQENPESHCKLEMLEVIPHTYAGRITWKDGTEGVCYLRKIE